MFTLLSVHATILLPVVVYHLSINMSGTLTTMLATTPRLDRRPVVFQGVQEEAPETSKSTL